MSQYNNIHSTKHIIVGRAGAGARSGAGAESDAGEGAGAGKACFLLRGPLGRLSVQLVISVCVFVCLFCNQNVL